LTGWVAAPFAAKVEGHEQSAYPELPSSAAKVSLPVGNGCHVVLTRWPRGGYAAAMRQAMDPDAKRDAWLRIWKHFFNHRRGPMGYSGVLVESPRVSH